MVPNSDVNKEIIQEKILLQSLTDEQEQHIQALRSKNDSLSKLSHEINELKQEKLLKEETESFQTFNVKKLIIASAIILVSVGLLFYGLTLINDTDNGLTSGYIIQNLKGDTIDTWLSWQIPPEKTLYVGIVQNQYLTNERLDVIRSVILSNDSIEIDDNLLHKGPPGSKSTYFLGWSGALGSISSQPTKYTIPDRFEIVSDTNPVGDIVILLTDMTSGDGYAGFTKSIADDSQNQILKSTITIYDIEKISNQELETLVRHEMGHALGLAHSTAPEDLMHPVILTDYPYISDCDLDAIFGLYDGKKKSEVVCES